MTRKKFDDYDKIEKHFLKKNIESNKRTMNDLVKFIGSVDYFLLVILATLGATNSIVILIYLGAISFVKFNLYLIGIPVIIELYLMLIYCVIKMAVKNKEARLNGRR